MLHEYMLWQWYTLVALAAPSISGARISPQLVLEQHSTKEIRLPIHNADDWLFTTNISLGNPPQRFTAAVDVGWSDLFVPSLGCLKTRPSYCAPHPLFNASASSTYHAFNRRSALHHFGFYTSGNVAQDSLHLGNVTVQGQTFQETDELRPTYFFDDTMYDAPLGLARRVVHSNESNLEAQSPLQNLIQRGALARNAFGLQLPQTPNDTGELLIGGVGDETPCDHCTVTKLPLRPRGSSNSAFRYTSHLSKRHTQPAYFLSGGWEVQPISMKFGDIVFNLSGHTAVFSSIDFWLELPYAFAHPVREKLGVSIWDGSIDCAARSAGHPNLEFTYQGFDGATHTMNMTADEYIRETPKLLPMLDPTKCQVPIGTHGDTDDDGVEIPKFIALGNIFLRKFTSHFGADSESITLIAD